jgi:hypothetical protein
MVFYIEQRNQVAAATAKKKERVSLTFSWRFSFFAA